MQAKSHNQKLGKKGENLAAVYLADAGYELLVSNFRAGRGDKLIETASIYLEEIAWDGPIRFDILSIDLSGKGEVTHFEDAFY